MYPYIFYNERRVTNIETPLLEIFKKYQNNIHY